MFILLLNLALLAFTIRLLLLCLPSRYKRQPVLRHVGKGKDASTLDCETSVQVLVLGDIGRSPRMQYHAMSIAKHGGRVDVVGYQESIPIARLVNSPLISIMPLSQPPLLQKLQANGIPFSIIGPLKVLWQICNLFYVLAYRTRPAKWLLVQNPPSIPTLAISSLICLLRNTRLLIDWHNYGWSILAGTRGASHPLVTISKFYEYYLGRWAPTKSFAVTNAMARQLRLPPYSIRSPVFTLHDRPAAIFQPITRTAMRLSSLDHIPETKSHSDDIMAGRTMLLVSSTSWTPDEDFGLLLDALVSYSSFKSSPSSLSLPNILAIITGKGPQRGHYMSRIASLTTSSKLEHVTILTAWLSMEDYALLLASADLGVSLHKSSSGVDLPMKVVDMFGAGLPVVGYCGYESWSELVREGENGRGFQTSEELCKLLIELFCETGRSDELKALKRGAIKEGKKRWDDEWDQVAGKVLGLT